MAPRAGALAPPTIIFWTAPLRGAITFPVNCRFTFRLSNFCFTARARGSGSNIDPYVCCIEKRGFAYDLYVVCSVLLALYGLQRLFQQKKVEV